MRLVDSILSRLKRPRRNDPVFGPMLYMGDSLKYWEGRTSFGPAATSIEVFVDGSAADDLEQQKRFYERFVQEWPNIKETIGKVILERWRQQHPEIPEQPLWKHFRVSSLSVPKASFEEADWEISFETQSGAIQLWTVHMKGVLPQSLAVDD
jgi:hypothetical protein